MDIFGGGAGDEMSRAIGNATMGGGRVAFRFGMEFIRESRAGVRIGWNLECYL